MLTGLCQRRLHQSKEMRPWKHSEQQKHMAAKPHKAQVIADSRLYTSTSNQASAEEQNAHCKICFALSQERNIYNSYVTRV
jgi:hypothetical protein